MTAAYKNLSACSVVLNNIDDVMSSRKLNQASGSSTPPVVVSNAKETAGEPQQQQQQSDQSDDDDDSEEGEMFEIEESESPHVPLYHLRDEGAVKWALLTDLCVLLKVKSKDTLLKQVR